MGYANTKTFLEIYASDTAFKTSYNASGFQTYFAPSTSPIDYLSILYNLLLAKYSNTRVASATEALFKAKVNSIIFQYGPNWVKQLELQKKLIELTDTELQVGTTSKSTHGFNPSTVPDGPNNTDTSIDTVNDQSLTKYTKSKLDAYATLADVLKKDVTAEFLNRFKNLFMITVDIDQYEEDDD